MSRTVDRKQRALAKRQRKPLIPSFTFRLLLAAMLLLLCATGGCHRSYYRRQADEAAKRLVSEKSSDPRWNAADGEIEVDPMSRMFNPFSKDHPPIPPDDPTSHQLMHCVDGQPNYPHWHANGDTSFVENPIWKSFLPINEDGAVVLSLDDAYQLALIHSSEYQQQKETLYLSALDVSLERFGFDTQLFAGFNSFFRTSGRLRDGSGQSRSELSSSLGATGGGIQFQRLGITGANFAVGLANSILFNFSGNNTQSANSLIDFSVIQPLLRGAGRERIMASLTQAERTLLANVRQFDRYRRGFYLNVAIGRNPGAGPNRSGDFLGLPSSASPNVGGYYGLLLQQQEIRNQEFNVRQLEAVLEQFREFFLRDRLDAVQLKLFESNVYGQQSGLVFARVAYQSAVDRFKISLGLPPDLEVIIEDDFLDRFELISDELNGRLIHIGKLRERTGVSLNRIDELIPEGGILAGDEPFAWSDELNQRLTDVSPFLAEAHDIIASMETDDLSQLANDLKKLDRVRENRIDWLKKLEQAIEAGEISADVDPQLYRADSIPRQDDLQRSLDGLDNEQSILNRLKRLKQNLEETRSLLGDLAEMQAGLKPEELHELIKERVLKTIPGLLSDLNSTLLELSLIQAQTRANSIEMFTVDLDAATATEIAREFRRDWMNARATLVDQWRVIEFVADQLESQVDLVFQGDIGNVGDNPFKLRYETGQLRAGFRFDAPIVRMFERNQYRAALINYHQSRRQFYQFEDEIKRNLRDIMRLMDRDKVLFELNRRSVQVQIEQIELNRFSLEEPVAPNANNPRFGAATARNLTDAIIGLNRFQDSFMGTWVRYEALRRSLDYDMGTMQLDELGFWIDPGVIDENIGLRAAAMMGLDANAPVFEEP